MSRVSRTVKQVMIERHGEAAWDSGREAVMEVAKVVENIVGFGMPIGEAYQVLTAVDAAASGRRDGSQ